MKAGYGRTLGNTALVVAFFAASQYAQAGNPLHHPRRCARRGEQQ